MTLQNLIKEVENLVECRKGGSGSGNFGHGGIKGHRGGSVSGGSVRGLPPSKQRLSQELDKINLEGAKMMRDKAFSKVEPGVVSWIKKASNSELKKSLDSLVQAYASNQQDKKLYDIMAATVAEDTYRFHSGMYNK